MPSSIPPSGNTPPPSSFPSPSSPASPPSGGGASGESMTDFMKLFTDEQRKKFMNILVQNLVREIDKSSKKYIEELRKEREDIENES